MSNPAHDKNFDIFKDSFEKNIYGTLKGKIRLNVLLNDLTCFLKETHVPLNILDAGCGSGQCSVHLAKKGHTVTLCDISTHMLNQAKILYKENHICSAAFIHKSIQEHCLQSDARYDLILCHAVLEWVSDPLGFLQNLYKMLKPHGHVSLMYFNRDRTVLKAVLRGNFYKKNSGFQFGNKKCLTPPNPLKQADVEGWINDLGLNVMEKSGIRMFYDYCETSIRDTLTEDQVLETELSFSKTEPYLSIARYIHLLCEKKDPSV